MKRALVAVASGVVALALAGSSDAAPRPTQVYLVDRGALVPVGRRSPTIAAAVRALLRGPTARERARGLRSAVPVGTPLLGVTVARRIVTVDLGERFVAGRDVDALRFRLGQLVRTVNALPGVLGVRVLVRGGTPLGLFPGSDLRRPLRSVEIPASRAPGIRDYQQLLADLGFMAPEGVTGSLDDRAAVAVLAFEKWSGLPRDGTLDGEVRRRLATAARPRPATMAAGRRVEVLLARQLALLIENGKVLRAVHISTGSSGTSTPSGAFSVYRKERLSWSVPFGVWMPWASYFTGGIAFHEYPIVPAYPASHGCVRVNRFDARLLYDFAARGTPVRVVYA